MQEPQTTYYQLLESVRNLLRLEAKSLQQRTRRIPTTQRNAKPVKKHSRKRSLSTSPRTRRHSFDDAFIRTTSSSVQSSSTIVTLSQFNLTRMKLTSLKQKEDKNSRHKKTRIKTLLDENIMGRSHKSANK